MDAAYGQVATTPDPPDGAPQPTPARVVELNVVDVGLWRGLTNARWIVQVLNGAPPPRDLAHSFPGLVAPN